MLFEHAYASQFGTFLGNNENERLVRMLTLNLVNTSLYLARKKKFIGPKKVIVWSSLMQVRFLQLVIGGNIKGFFPFTIRTL